MKKIAVIALALVAALVISLTNGVIAVSEFRVWRRQFLAHMR